MIVRFCGENQRGVCLYGKSGAPIAILVSRKKFSRKLPPEILNLACSYRGYIPRFAYGGYPQPHDRALSLRAGGHCVCCFRSHAPHRLADWSRDGDYCEGDFTHGSIFTLVMNSKCSVPPSTRWRRRSIRIPHLVYQSEWPKS